MKDKYSFFMIVALCVSADVWLGFDPIYVIALSLGLMFSAATYYFVNRYLKYAVLLIMLLITQRIPSLIVYTPITLYFLLDREDALSYLLAILPILTTLMNPIGYSIVVAILTPVSVFLSLKDDRYGKLKSDYYGYFSKSREAQIRLIDANTMLNESQNNNIHIALLEDRNRIARDIHDGVGHSISRAILQTGALIITETDEERKIALSEVKNTLSSSMDQLRKSVHNLVEENIDLENSLTQIIDKFDFCKLIFTYELKYQGNLNFNYSILFIVQEALNNVIKHSNANVVDLSLRDTKDSIYLLIKDNGKNCRIDDMGIGLASMKSRVDNLNGNIDFSTENGFRIFIILRKDKL